MIAAGAMFFATGGFAVAQSKLFTALPVTGLHDYELRIGDRYQKFNGTFVSRLVQRMAAAGDRACLRALPNSLITVDTYESGAVQTRSGLSCLSNALSQTQSRVTDSVSLQAGRILALILASERFNQAQQFSRNDRDLSHYDVELYGKNGLIVVSLMPLPSSFICCYAGCPPTGTIGVVYFMDPNTFAIKRGRMVC